MSAKSILLIVLNVAIAICLIKIILGSFKNFKKAIFYFLMPDIISIFRNDFSNDVSYSYRLLLIIVLLIAIVLIEVRIFY